MTDAEWLDHWEQYAPLLSDECLRDLMERLQKEEEE